MIHLYRHERGRLKNKFDVALVVRGKLIWSSMQGYDRKSGCYNLLKLTLNQINFPKSEIIYFQDDTDMKKYYIGLHQPKPTLQSKQGKPFKPYLPK